MRAMPLACAAIACAAMSLGGFAAASARADEAFAPLARRSGGYAVPIASRTANERGPGSTKLKWQPYRRMRYQTGGSERTTSHSRSSRAGQVQLIAAHDSGQPAEPRMLHDGHADAARPIAAALTIRRTEIVQTSGTESDDPFQNPFGDPVSQKTTTTNAQLQDAINDTQLDEPADSTQPRLAPSESQPPAEVEPEPGQPDAAQPTPSQDDALQEPGALPSDLDPGTVPDANTPPSASDQQAPQELQRPPSSEDEEQLPPPSGADEEPTTDVGCDAEKRECDAAMRALRERGLSSIGLDIVVTGAEGKDFPCECTLEGGEFAGRMWHCTCFTWKASSLCHKPLYFEDVAMERYGHSPNPLAAPFVSAAHFFVTLPVLPYAMALCPPDECQYALGYYRPGNCAPYLVDPIPLSLKAGLVEAGTIAGAILIIP